MADEAEKPTNVFAQMANADPAVLAAIFEGLRPLVQAASGAPNCPAVPVLRPDKT